MEDSAEESKLLLALRVEVAAELKDVNTEETTIPELGTLDGTSAMLEDGAASTRVASWMRPNATRRPVESFMVSDTVGVEREFPHLHFLLIQN